MRRTPRRIARAGYVARCWAGYAVKQRSLEPFRDFRAWAWTTFVDPDLIAAGIPWTTFAARRWLEGYLRPEMRVFEWGMGGSTVFFARRVRRVVSIEHQAEWYTEVARRLEHSEVRNADLRLIPPEGASPETRQQCLSSDPKFAGMSFTAYVHSIAAEPDGSLDLVLVDGRARASCIAAARSKVRRGGALVVDDADRVDTKPGLELLEGADAWRAVHLAGPGPANRWPVFWRTSVFIKG